MGENFAIEKCARDEMFMKMERKEWKIIAQKNILECEGIYNNKKAISFIKGKF